MAASLDQICTAIASTLNTYYQAQGVPMQVYDDVPGQIAVPCIVIEPSEGEYHQTFGEGATDHTVTAIVIFHLGDRRSAQMGLLPFISATGSKSIKAAIASDPRLGNVVKHADAKRYRDFGTRRWNEVDYLMATVDISILE
jgi:hypothetical protein